MPKIKTIPLLEIIFKNNGGTSDIWKAISELLHNKEDEIAVFCPYIKNKINSYNKETSILALTLLDFCVDDGKMPLWSALNTKNFLGSMVNSLKTREETDIQNMILYLIQKWGNKFSGNDELSNFSIVYNKLRNNNITFPTETNYSYTKYVKLNKPLLTNQYSFSNKSKDNYNTRKNKSINQIQVETDPDNYLKDINVNLNTSSYDKIYRRLVNKLYDWTHAIHEVNVLINQNTNGNNNSKIEGLLKDLTKGNKQLIETIQSGKLKDRILMEISLNVTDDINMTLGRWNNYKNRRDPGPFVSSFFQNDEWRNKMLKNDNNNNSNYNNINNFYNIMNSTFNNNINNSSNFNNNINNNNNYNKINNNAMNQFNNNNFMDNPELKNYPKLYEKLRNSNINNNNYQNNNNNNNYPNFETYNNINKQNNNNNNFNDNNNNNINNNNQGSFNLLIDFDSAPTTSITSNKNKEPNLNLNDKNNMDKFVDFIAMTEKQNQINNKKNENINSNINNTMNMLNNLNFNNNYENKNMNNNDIYNYENRDMDNPYNERKFSNDINTSKINKSVVYPTFEELEESNQNNNNNNINPNKIKKEEVDILSKFDF